MLKRFSQEFFRRWKDDNVSATGAQLAYYLVLSLFPLLIFVLTLVPYTPLGDQDILSELLAYLPESASELISGVVNDVIANRSGALLSFALIMTLWSASSGMANLMAAMDKAFDTTRKRNPLLKRLLSLLFTFLLVVIIIVTLVSQVFGEVIVDLLARSAIPTSWVIQAWKVTKAILPLIIMCLGFGFLYRFAPAFTKDDKISFRDALFGGTIAAIGWTLISLAFSFYVSNFANYANTYGSIGGFIVLLVWLYLSSLVIMVGAEAAASLVAARQIQEE